MPPGDATPLVRLVESLISESRKIKDQASKFWRLIMFWITKMKFVVRPCIGPFSSSVHLVDNAPRLSSPLLFVTKEELSTLLFFAKPRAGVPGVFHRHPRPLIDVVRCYIDGSTASRDMGEKILSLVTTNKDHLLTYPEAIASAALETQILDAGSNVSSLIDLMRIGP